MWAVRLHKYHDRPRVEEVDGPGIGRPYGVLVDWRCRAVPTDPRIVDGQSADRSRVTLPYTCGYEYAGWVCEVGPTTGVLDLTRGSGRRGGALAAVNDAIDELISGRLRSRGIP